MMAAFCFCPTDCPTDRLGYRCGAPLRDDFLRRLELPGRVARVPRREVFQARAVRLSAERLQRVRDPDQIITTLERVARRMARAAVGVQAGDIEPADAALPELRIDFGRDERRIRGLADDQVAVLGPELVRDL